MKNLSFKNAQTVGNFYTAIHSNLVEKELEDKVFSLTHLDFFKWFDQKASRFDQNAWFLDVGTGRHATYLNYIFRKGFKNLVGIELNPESAKFVEMNYKHINLRNESIFETKLASGGHKFDLITCFGVTHHTLDTFGCLKIFKSLLKDDGTLYFGVFAFENTVSEYLVRVLRLIFSMLPFRFFNKLFRNSVLLHTTVLDLAYVPVIYLFSNKDIENYAARLKMQIVEHFPVAADPFQRTIFGRFLTGDGFMRIYVLKHTHVSNAESASGDKQLNHDAKCQESITEYERHI